MDHLLVNGKQYGIYSRTGTVVSAGKRQETSVSGGGGGGSYYNGTGYNAPITYSTTTTVYDDIHIVAQDGSEHSLRFVDIDVSCREGNEITALWLIRQGNERGRYVAVYNKTTKELCWNRLALDEIHKLNGCLWLLVLSITLPFSALCLLVALLNEGVPIPGVYLYMPAGPVALAFFLRARKKNAATREQTKQTIATLIKAI